MTIKVFTDGASRGNPGHAGAGAIIYKDSSILDQVSQYLGKKTNNEAEYTAVILAIQKLIDHKEQEATFYCDSQLLVKQLNGQYKVKAPTIIPLFKQIKALTQNMNLKFNWVRREQNSEADVLANRGIDER